MKSLTIYFTTFTCKKIHMNGIAAQRKLTDFVYVKMRETWKFSGKYLILLPKTFFNFVCLEIGGIGHKWLLGAGAKVGNGSDLLLRYYMLWMIIDVSQLVTINVSPYHKPNIVQMNELKSGKCNLKDPLSKYNCQLHKACISFFTTWDSILRFLTFMDDRRFFFEKQNNRKHRTTTIL